VAVALSTPPTFGGFLTPKLNPNRTVLSSKSKQQKRVDQSTLFIIVAIRAGKLSTDLLLLMLNAFYKYQ
jgi:hypothetical protein